MGLQLNNSTRVGDHAISVCSFAFAGRHAQIASPVPTNTTPSRQFRWLAQPRLHGLTLPKLPLQKGRADVAALTTGIDEMV